MAAAMRRETFDFTKDVVLPERYLQRLVPARDVRLSLIHGGFYLSGRSDGTSLFVLPVQFSQPACSRRKGAHRTRRSTYDR